MLFGSTGVGKSTALHLLAGAKFSFEAVELAPDESAADEFGGPDTELQLITQKKIPGCVIGDEFLFQVKYCLAPLLAHGSIYSFNAWRMPL